MPAEPARRQVGIPFPVGNQYARGNKGSRGNPITQVLISQLNEVDKNTSREKIHELVEKLIGLALGTQRTVPVYETRYDKKLKRNVTVTPLKQAIDPETTLPVFRTEGEPPDMHAIAHIFDRVEGKPKQTIEHEGDLPKGDMQVLSLQFGSMTPEQLTEAFNLLRSDRKLVLADQQPRSLEQRPGTQSNN